MGLFSAPLDRGGLPVLTLPGIAGGILTIGMAVDANVMIRARIREKKHGKPAGSVAVMTRPLLPFWTQPYYYNGGRAVYFRHRASARL